MNNKTRFSNFFFKNYFKNKTLFNSFKKTNFTNKSTIAFSNKLNLYNIFFLKNTLLVSLNQKYLSFTKNKHLALNSENENESECLKDVNFNINDMLLLVKQGKILKNLKKKENLWNTLTQLKAISNKN